MRNNVSNVNLENYKSAFLLMIGAFFVICLFTDPTWAVTVEKLQEPIKDLKKEIFGGWMVALQICAAAMGILLSIFRGSLAPFGIGGGITMGIHFLDKYLGDGSSGAFI